MKETPARVYGDTLVYHEQGATIQVQVGMPDWYRWLETVGSFAFQGEQGSFTASKEQSGSKRGGRYWKAYRKREGRRAIVYLGKSEHLTLERLKAAAVTLSGQEEAATLPDRTREANRNEAIAQTPQPKSPQENGASRTSQRVRDQLLSTKFFVPAPPHAVIPRPRLAALLNAGLSRTLTLVSAPAGFGKTTLLASWVQSGPLGNPHVAWISLDEGDNSLVRFWEYVLTALDLRKPGLFTPLLTYLQSEQTLPLQYFLQALINILVDRAEQFLLILDDYEVITQQEIHTTLTYLLEHLPPQLRLIVLSRTDPPLPLARLRGRDQVLEVRAAQLRCTSQEATAFLTQTMGLSLSPGEIREVEAPTEGWIAGLQLAALSMQGHLHPAAIIHELSGTPRYIVDYLTDEVLRKQPESIQTFLLRTAILERLCASLCDYVTGESGSQQALEYLEHANLFVVPLDTQRQWYRYHHLFAEALHYRLEHTHGEESHILHHRASQWYAQHGHLDEAVQHAINAREWSWAADLIEQAPPAPTWDFNLLEKQRHWLEKLPPEVLHARPRLCFTYARTLHMVAPPTETEAWLQVAEAASAALLSAPAAESGSPAALATADEARRLLGEVAALRAVHISVYQGDGQAALAFCQQALALLPEQHLAARSDVALAQCSASIAMGDIRKATHFGLQASALAQATGNPFTAITILNSVATGLLISGQLHEIRHIVEQATRLAQRSKGLPFPLESWPMAAQADMLREWNQLDAAQDIALRAIRIGEETGTTVFSARAYMALMRIHLARGELDAARSLLQRAEQTLAKVPYPYLSAFFITVDRVRLWLARGELEQASYWAQELLQHPRQPSLTACEKEDIALVRILLAQEKPEQALERLEPLLARAQAGQRWGHVIEMLILQAQAYQMRHDVTKSLVTVSEAVRLAEPEGYIRRFVDEGQQMAALLSSLREQQRKRGSTPYLDMLLAAFTQNGTKREEAAVSQHLRTPPALLDPLSGRELEVLHLVEEGASNQEIAERLVLALVTVKRHMSNILSKLGVNSRTQALARARALGLFAGEM